MSPLLTLKEAAAELRVSKQWLQYWLVEHPVDATGMESRQRIRGEGQMLDKFSKYVPAVSPLAVAASAPGCPCIPR